MASDTEPAELVEPDASDIGSGSPLGAGILKGAYDIPLTVTVVLGRTNMEVSQLLKLGRGAVVDLDGRLGDVVDI